MELSPIKNEKVPENTMNELSVSNLDATNELMEKNNIIYGDELAIDNVKTLEKHLLASSFGVF